MRRARDCALLVDGDVRVVVVSSGEIEGIVHPAAVVGAPVLIVTGVPNDLSLSDLVFDSKVFGIVFHPVRQLPPGFQSRSGGAFADGLAHVDVAGSA